MTNLLVDFAKEYKKELLARAAEARAERDILQERAKLPAEIGDVPYRFGAELASMHSDPDPGRSDAATVGDVTPSERGYWLSRGIDISPDNSDSEAALTIEQHVRRYLHEDNGA